MDERSSAFGQWVFYYHELTNKWMLKKYYISLDRETNGHQQVHQENCEQLLTTETSVYVGEFYSCWAAVAAVLKTYPTADWCEACCRGHENET